MVVDEETAGATSEHWGETHYFCACGCKVAFHKDPDRYLKGEGEHHGMHEMHH